MSKIQNPKRNLICARKLKEYIKANENIKTQERFAEIIGVNVRTVKRWVTKGVDSLTTVKYISDSLGISDTFLLSDD